MMEQAPSALQVASLRRMLKTRNKLVMPNSAPYGQAYLHQGRSTKNDRPRVSPKMTNPTMDTSLVQKLNRAKYGS